jgi:hypothetical protein
MAEGYSELANERVSAADGVGYAYRDTGGDGRVPLVLLQHFRGNLDNWDPALIDALASARRVITSGEPRRVADERSLRPGVGKPAGLMHPSPSAPYRRPGQ